MDIKVYGDVYINDKKERKISTIRTSSKLATVKKIVKERDKFCICCGDIGVNGQLEVHHIMPLAKYKDLATDEHNMVALCQKCHRKYHEEYKDCEGADTFAKWILSNRGY